MGRLVFASALLVFLLAAFPWHVKADDYEGEALHRYPALRTFWREFTTEVGTHMPPWLRRRYVTGNWEGQRNTLAAWGINPTVTYVTNILGNPLGGKRHKIAYDDNIGVDINVDLEKSLGLAGLVFHVSGSSRSGQDLSALALDNTFTASNIYGGETVRLYALHVEQSLFADKVSLLLGRFGAGDEFLTSPLYSLFLNAAFNGNPISVPINVPAFSYYPFAQWGVRATVKPTEEWYGMGAVYNGDTTLARNSAHGVDFSLRHDSEVFVIGEIGYTPNSGPASVGLAGNYKLGGYYDSGTFQDFYHDRKGGSYIRSGLPPAEKHGNYGLYVLVDQQVYREGGPGSDQGMTPFAGVTFAPSDINTFPFFFMAGLAYDGLIPGRDRDTTAFGLAYGQFSNDLRRSQRASQSINSTSTGVQDFEMVIELTYQWELSPCLIVQPDLQYSIQPGGTGSIPSALILGVQLAANF